METHLVYIAAGTNLGNRLENLQFAAQLLSPAVKILRSSRIYQTEPWGYEEQADFLNLVWEAETALTPDSLLGFLKSIEKRMGREQTVRYGPRIIDLDILLYDQLILEGEWLTVPHDQLHNRRFALAPLCDLIPDGIHPKSQLRFSEILEALPPSVCDVVSESFQFDHPIFRFGQKTYLMGILNLTADSFSQDGILAKSGSFIDNALNQANSFLTDGADILDLGAESTRPGFSPVDEKEEIRRLIPVIEKIKNRHPNTILSIDTTKVAVARAALEAGADWINDVSGASDDAMAELIAEAECPLVLMRFEKLNPQQSTLTQVIVQLNTLVAHALSRGVKKEQILLDPGLGFGTNSWQNVEILNGLQPVKQLGFPLLVGPSRKSFIGNLLQKPVSERVSGTAAATAISVLYGADILRLHDVKFMKEFLFMTDLLKN